MGNVKIKYPKASGIYDSNVLYVYELTSCAFKVNSEMAMMDNNEESLINETNCPAKAGNTLFITCGITINR